MEGTRAKMLRLKLSILLFEANNTIYYNGRGVKSFCLETNYQVPCTKTLITRREQRN